MIYFGLFVICVVALYLWAVFAAASDADDAMERWLEENGYEAEEVREDD